MRSPRYRFGFAASALLLTLAANAAAEPSAPRAGPPGAAAFPGAALDPAELVLFSVQLNGLTLTEGLASYGAPDDPLVPLGELTRLLEADVDVLPAVGRVSGSLGQARRALLLDLPTRTARIGGETIAFTDRDVAVGPTDIYVRVPLLETLLRVEASLDGEGLIMALHAPDPFPVQARLARLAHRPDGGGGLLQEPPLQVLTPYRLLSPPGLDVVLEAGARARSPRYPFRYDIRLGADLFYSNLQGYLASDETGRPSSARLLLQRRSLEGGMFGPMHVRQFDVGDVYAPALALGPTGVGGRGFVLSTAPLTQTDVFNRIDLRGELPPGNDVELYINDVLKDSTNQATSGLYEFLNVPLSPGVNVIRVVTYGSRGERSETVRVINVGAGLLHRGEGVFQFGAVQQNTPLFELSDRQPIAGSKPTELADGKLRVVGGFDYGLTEFLTLSAGAAVAPRPGESSLQIYNLGLRTSLFGLATQLDAGHDSDGGDAVALGLAGSFRGFSGVLRHGEYRNGFVDENAVGSSSVLPLERRTEVSLDSGLRLRGRVLPMSLRLLRNEYVDESNDFAAVARVSTSLARVLVSSGLEYERRNPAGARATETLSGYLTASTFASYSWQLRASLDYALLPEPRARLLALTVDHALNDLWSLRFALAQPLDDLDGVSVGVSAVNRTRYGDLLLGGEYDNGDGSWRVAAQWSFGLGFDPAAGGYLLTRTGPGSGGSVVLDAFVDADGDGLRGADEAPVSNAVLDGGQQNRTATGERGTAFATGLGPGPLSSLRVALDGIDNPSVSSPPSTVQFQTRPGAVTRVPYPLRPTGDVAITVQLVRDDGRTVGLSAVRVQLVPEHGSTPIDGVTEFDGSVVFSQIPSGAYQARLEPAQAAQLRMRALQPVSVTIKADGSFTKDAVMQVQFEPATDLAQSAPTAS